MTQWKTLPAGHPLHLALGFTLWLLWFGLLYGAQGLGCAVAPPPAGQGAANAVNAALAGLTLVFLAGFVWAAVVAGRAAAQPGPAADAPRAPLARFMASVAAVLYGAAAVSTLVVGLPVLFLPPCI